jgi:hypothetical protein
VAIPSETLSAEASTGVRGSDENLSHSASILFTDADLHRLEPCDPLKKEFHEIERPVGTASSNRVRQATCRTSAGPWRNHAAELRPAARGAE